MFKKFKLFLIIYTMILAFSFVVYSHAKPPKPGPNFVWVKPHTTPNGILIPGHWKHVGSSQKGKVWVPGHRAPNGKWVSGHWKTITPPRPGAVWIPGDYGPNGDWIPGYWR